MTLLITYFVPSEPKCASVLIFGSFHELMSSINMIPAKLLLHAHFTKAALCTADQIAQIPRTIWTGLAWQLGYLGNNKEMQF